jgi:pyruvate,water dikinase
MFEILWLDRPGCDDPKRVGGKAASLARLAARFPVPLGFCLPTSASCDVSAISPGVRDAVVDAYAALGARCGEDEPAVAVRSSAIDEDGALASFAGIFSSYLNVRGVSDVLRAITRCWASADDPRVRAYRQRSVGTRERLGVLVQVLVPADISAVVFSVNPTSGACEELVINANWGLGESVVGGLVTPDTWILRRPELSTLKFLLGDKQQMTIRVDTGTREVPVLRTLRARACLNDAQLRELGALALQLEAVTGEAVDLECAYAGGELFLLQCRPVTGLARSVDR